MEIFLCPPASGEKERTHRSKELNESILAGKLGVEVIFGQFHCTTSLGGGQGSREGGSTNKVLGHLRAGRMRENCILQFAVDGQMKITLGMIQMSQISSDIQGEEYHWKGHQKCKNE